jgi:hypothetical protein
MRSKAEPPFSLQIPSVTSVWFLAVVCGFGVFFAALALQWLIYDDWMHRSGPLRIVGSALATVLTFIVVMRWQSAIRDRKIEMLRRFETIKWMNDRIRNALQAIECITYAADPKATESVRNAVDAIEVVLNDVLIVSHPAPEAATRSAIQPSQPEA